jgi:hypothetical protein
MTVGCPVIAGHDPGEVTFFTPGDETLTVTDTVSGISGSTTVHL